MVQRSEVFDAINGERAYQDAMQGNSARLDVDDNRDLGALITLIDVYMDKVKTAFAGPHPQGKLNALDQLRKVTALGVLAMEKHGTLFRKVS